MGTEVVRDSPPNVRALQPQLERDGWRVFLMPDGIDGKAAFFDAVVASFPLDPPLARVRDVWDALDDSLSAGLLGIPARKIAILWPDSERLAMTEPDSYEIAVGILSSLADTLRHGEWTNDGRPKETALFLGTTPGHP